MKNNPHRERPERTFARPHLSKLVVSFNNPMLLSVMCVASPSSEPFSELHCRTATASTTGQPDRRGLRTRDRLRLPVGTNRAGLVLRLSAQGIERLSQPAK